MKQKYLVCFLMFVYLSGLCRAQKKESVHRMEANNISINFNKLETDYTQLQNQLNELEQQKTKLLSQMHTLNEQQKQVTLQVENLEKSYNGMGGSGNTSGAAGGSDNVIGTAGDDSQDQLLAATKQMQETQMSFNLQYLQLQSQMQNENRSYTAVSNIMKTKHDTVKNSISNVR